MLASRSVPFVMIKDLVGEDGALHFEQLVLLGISCNPLLAYHIFLSTGLHKVEGLDLLFVLISVGLFCASFWSYFLLN